MSGYLMALLVGIAAGSHAATWGMYKDSIYEGFSWWKFLRSILLASLLAILAQSVLELDLARAGSVIVLFGVTYVLERGLFEFYKVFLREEDQSKYFIPMAFAVGGKVVNNRLLRRLAGAGYLGLVSAAVVAVDALAEARIPLPAAVPVVLVGTVTGWLSAFGGAWKDAPLEGFQLLKFLRSPAIAAAYALVLALITDSYPVIALGALGFTIATIESYKKFFSPNKAPGKFTGKPVRHPEMFRLRRPFAVVYLAIWVLLLMSFWLAFTEPRQGVL